MSLHALIHDSELLRRRLEFAQEAFPEGKSTLAQDLLDLRHLFDKVLSDLDQPLFEPIYFYPENPPSSEDYNSNLRGAWADIKLLNAELSSVADLEGTLFSYTSIGLEDLLSDISGITSMLTDLKLVGGMIRGDILVGGDDFIDESKRDSSRTVASSPAEIALGSLGLHRDGAESVDIDSLNPRAVSAPRGQVCDPIDCYYEGRFFAPMGDQRPEGGTFNIQELGPEAISGQAPQLSDNVLDLGNYTFYKLQRPPERILDEFREAAYDGRPDTFWEYETYVQAYEQPATTGALSGIPNRSVVSNRGAFRVSLTITLQEEAPVNTVELWPVQFDPNTPITVEGLYYSSPDSEQFKPIPNWDAYKTDKIITRVANKYMTSRQKSALMAFSKGGFKGRAIFPFQSITASKIRIDLSVPRGYPIVYERLYSIFKNTVTVHVRKKRRFHHSKHKTYVYNLQVLMKLSYLQTLALYIQKAKPSDLLRGTPPTTKLLKNKSGYDIFGRMAAGSMFGAGFGAALGAFIPKLGDFLAKVISKIPIVGKIFKKLFGVKIKVWSEETGWKSEKVWFQPQFDLARYAIGIRELTIGHYTYAPVSEYISKPFYSPKEISKVMLVADSVIPDAFPAGRQYIKYYIQPDIPNYTKWHRINPQGQAPVFDEDGSTVPKIINFNVKSPDADEFENKYITTDEAPKGIRVRIVLSRPDSDEPLLKGSTPLLKSYRLLIYPKGGL